MTPLHDHNFTWNLTFYGNTVRLQCVFMTWMTILQILFKRSLLAYTLDSKLDQGAWELSWGLGNILRRIIMILFVHFVHSFPKSWALQNCVVYQNEYNASFGILSQICWLETVLIINQLIMKTYLYDIHDYIGFKIP